MTFHGAKAALICGSRLAVLRRDELPGLCWAGRIDLPGGGREGGESPADCAAREVREEIGISIAPARFHWGRAFPAQGRAGWMLAAAISDAEAGAMQLGDEGQACWMMEIDAFLAASDAVPHLQDRLRIYLTERV